MNKENMLSRITRDIADGLIVLDTRGTVNFVNPNAAILLGHDQIKTGQKYAQIMADDFREENDEFHQFLLDSIYDKRKTHKGKLSYTCPDGKKKIFNLTCSFLFSENGKEKEGVVIQFLDVTKETELENKHRNTAFAFAILVGVLCVWIFFYATWELLGRPIQGGLMTIMVEAVCIVGVLLCQHFTNLDLSFKGFNSKGNERYLIIDSLATAIILTIMLIAKACIIKYVPTVFGPDAKLIDFSRWTIFDTFYPLTVILQEYLSREVVHGVIRNVVPGKNANKIAIILSSLYFGALHVYLGLPYMFGAAILLGLFGVVYTKQKTIWGLCIPHYFLGLAMTVILAF